MLKYDFNNNQAVVDLPSIWKIGDGKVSITHASGTDTTSIPNNSYLTIKVGNIDSINNLDETDENIATIKNKTRGQTIMEINGNVISLSQGEEITIKVDSAEKQSDTPQESSKLSFDDMLNLFNEVLNIPVKNTMTVYTYLKQEFDYAKREWDDPNSDYFSSTNLPEVYEYNGNNTELQDLAYNAMQSWLMASQLAEYVPTSGLVVNTQTRLFRKAWDIGGGVETPMYGDYDIRSDVNKVREIAAYICSYLHSQYDGTDKIATFRSELGGNMINASSWEELGYRNTTLTDAIGRRGYRTDYIGYLVNTQMFMPNGAGPRVEGTTICDLALPYKEGSPILIFNTSTQNYTMDETINNEMVLNWNMMAQTPLSEWNSYSTAKKNRIVNAMATIPCTTAYMFGAPKPVQLVLDNGQLPVVDGYPRYVFEQTNSSDLVLDGPFSNLAGIYRYNISSSLRNNYEIFIDTVLGIADNSRFPTQDPNYGRCRPGCKVSRQVMEKNPIHGSKENELYNISISALVADNDTQKQSILSEDGWAADSPRSYVSGHSAQVVAMALILGQLDTTNLFDYMRKAHEYSVNRSIARFHWMSDVIYGRLFGTMIVPILRAMSGLQNGFVQMKNYISDPQPTPTGNWKANLIIKNQTGSPITSTGEIRLYVNNHIGVNTYLPGADVTAGALYTFNVGENDFSNEEVYCILNGNEAMTDDYNGLIISEVRFYDSRHWNNIDAGYNASLDTNDPRCDRTLKKSGGTYVINITNI